MCTAEVLPWQWGLSWAPPPPRGLRGGTPAPVPGPVTAQTGSQTGCYGAHRHCHPERGSTPKPPISPRRAPALRRTRCPPGVPRSPRCPVPAALTRVCSYCSSRCASLSEAMVPPLPPLLAVPVPVPVPAAAAAAPPGPCGADPGHCPGEGPAALRLRRQRPAPAASAGQEVTGPGAARVCGGLSCSGVPSTRGLCPQVSQLRVAPVGSRWGKTGVGWPRVQLPVGHVVPSSHGHKGLAWGWRCPCFPVVSPRWHVGSRAGRAVLGTPGAASAQAHGHAWLGVRFGGAECLRSWH